MDNDSDATSIDQHLQPKFNSSGPLVSDVSSAIVMVFNASVGVIVTGLHSLVFLTIMMVRKLRQQRDLVIFAVYCVAEIFVGLTLLSYGSTFADSALNPGKYAGKVSSALDCMSQPFMTFLVIGYNLLVLMQLALSIDRLICTLTFLTYMKLGKKYLLAVIGVPVTAVATLYIFTWVSITNTSKGAQFQFQTPCAPGPTFVPPYVDTLMNNFQYTACGLSILIYGYIMVGLRFGKTSSFSAVQLKQAKRQARITKTLGILTLCTLLFFLLPLVTLHNVSSNLSVEVASKVVPIMTTIMEFYSLCNIIVYLGRHNDVKQEIWTLFCKNKPKPRGNIIVPITR